MTDKISGLWNIFHICHEWNVNKFLHFIGFSLVFLWIIYKNIYLVLLGGIIQELGHVYQYYQTKDKKHSPFTCMKPQSLFAYPIFFLIIMYVIFF